MANIALQVLRHVNEHHQHAPNPGQRRNNDNRQPAGSLYHKAIILLIISLFAYNVQHIPPDVAQAFCEILSHVSPFAAKLEMCQDAKFNIPDFGKIFDYGASVFEQLNITGAKAENRARLAVEISDGYRVMSDVKSLVKHSDIPNRVQLADSIQSYATDARNTAELIMETDFQAKITFDKFIRVTSYITSILEDARGKNMGRAVKILWIEFRTGIEKHVKELNAVINLAARSKIKLQDLADKLQAINDLIIQAKKGVNSIIDPKKETQVFQDLWIVTGNPKNDYSEDMKLLDKLSKQRELGSDRVERTSQLLQKFISYLEGMRDPANDIVLSQDNKDALEFISLVNNMNGAIARMVKIQNSINAEPVVLNEKT